MFPPPLLPRTAPRRDTTHPRAHVPSRLGGGRVEKGGGRARPHLSASRAPDRGGGERKGKQGEVGRSILAATKPECTHSHSGVSARPAKRAPHNAFSSAQLGVLSKLEQTSRNRRPRNPRSRRSTAAIFNRPVAAAAAVALPNAGTHAHTHTQTHAQQGELPVPGVFRNSPKAVSLVLATLAIPADRRRARLAAAR